jgi:hypothetical protein
MMPLEAVDRNFPVHVVTSCLKVDKDLITSTLGYSDFHNLVGFTSKKDAK